MKKEKQIENCLIHMQKWKLLQLIEYMQYPKQSDMNIMFNVSMHMPNITFCMSRQQAWSNFPLNNLTLANEWDEVVKVSIQF